MAQFMAEHEHIVWALEMGTSDLAADAVRDHVAVQGEKLRHLMATPNSVAVVRQTVFRAQGMTDLTVVPPIRDHR